MLRQNSYMPCADAEGHTAAGRRRSAWQGMLEEALPSAPTVGGSDLTVGSLDIQSWPVIPKSHCIISMNPLRR